MPFSRSCRPPLTALAALRAERPIRKRPTFLPAFAALLALALLAAACASSDDSGSGDTNADSSADDSSNASESAPAGADDQNTTRESRSNDIQRTAVDQIPGDEPTVVASALRGDRNNPLFGQPLVDPDRIISGGPPPDGIPPIDIPSFELVSRVDWLEPQEAVISLDFNGEARAYPVRILISHEIVNDTFGDIPVTVTYCPLCNSAVVFERRVDSRTFTFGTSGSLFNSALVMYDRQTESLWTHYDGQAVVGELVGTQLPLIPAATVSWGTFSTEHPDGLVLSRNTGYNRNYGSNPYVGYDDPDTFPFLFSGATDERLPAKTRVVAIRHGGQELAVVLDELAELGVVALEVGEQNEAVVVFHLPGTATPLENRSIALGRDVGATGVYLSELDGRALTFERTTDNEFVDNETGSVWSLLGRATSGPLEGAQLTPVERLDTFWFAIAAYSPDVEIVSVG